MTIFYTLIIIGFIITFFAGFCLGDWVGIKSTEQRWNIAVLKAEAHREFNQK